MPKKNQSRIAEQELPEIKDGVSICRVGVARGGSQFEVWDGESTWLVELPKRFRKAVWVRRGSFVLVEVGNSSVGLGVRGEIVYVLRKEHISQLKKETRWPSTIDQLPDVASATDIEEIFHDDETGHASTKEHADDSSDSELFQNNNRR